MSSSGNHPDRAQMLKAIRSGSVPFAEHMESCSACRTLFRILSETHLAGSRPLEQPSQELLERCTAIPAAHETNRSRQRVAGALAYDSWSGLAVAGLRDVPTGLIRRLRLTAGDLSLEVVAERKQDHWRFVARVYRGEETTAEYALTAGGKMLLPRAQGFYHWTSRQTPGTIRLISDSEEVNFVKVSWT